MTRVTRLRPSGLRVEGGECWRRDGVEADVREPGACGHGLCSRSSTVASVAVGASFE